MQYMLLIYSEESDTPPPAEAQEQVIKAYFAYNDALKKAGAFVAGDALEATSTATTVRVRGPEELVTDGPFAETTEALGGYYLIDVENIDEAVAWAKKCPGSHHGTVEVRPVMNIPGDG